MNAGFATASECDHAPETVAAQLTEAVFPVALRYGGNDLWIDLELDLWHVLAETVKKWSWALSRGDLERWWDGFLVDLADAAYLTARRHGTHGSSPQARTGLYQAFRSAIRETIGSN
jgi:hypothetical protein